MPNSLTEQTEDGRYSTVPLSSGAQLVPGLAVYRFAHSLYYANANQLTEEVVDILKAADPPLRWFCIDASAVADVDYSAAEALSEIHHEASESEVRLVLCHVADDVRAELDRYGLTESIGVDAIYDRTGDVVEAFGRAVPMSKSGSGESPRS